MKHKETWGLWNNYAEEDNMERVASFIYSFSLFAQK